MLTEEVILAEERTTEEEKMHIIEGRVHRFIPLLYLIFTYDLDIFLFINYQLAHIKNMFFLIH